MPAAYGPSIINKNKDRGFLKYGNTEWQWGGTAINTSYPNILNNHWYGFVYEIACPELDKYYIGKKYFHSFRGNRKHESDWRTYWGSCVPLQNELISRSANAFSRKILVICQTKMQVDYMEISYQFQNNVLFQKNGFGDYKYWNSAIPSGRFFRKDFQL